MRSTDLLLPLLPLALALAAPAGGQDSCPSSCYCDAQLNVNCVGDTIWRFPEGIPPAVTRLELRNYVITTLGADELGAFTNLTELKAPQNSIASIENGSFSALAALQKLDLSQNDIASVTAGTFTGLVKTRSLDLSSNQLRECEGAFADLASLEQLTLRGNQLARLGSRTLAGLAKLQYLNVDSNAIADIDVAAFQGLASLAHLILSNNPLSNLSRLEFFGSRLQYIDVSAVGLTRVPQSLTQYVRDLRLAKNNFTVLRRGDFDSYPYLGLLVLDDSGVTQLEEDALGRHEYLLRLWMNGNRLERVPASLPPSLKALYLEENRIGALRANEFKGLSVLEQLFLQRNLIEVVEDCAFCGLAGLKNLDLQANRIARLSSGSFSGLVALESLDLSQNPLAVIEPRAFAPFLSLTTLQLSRVSGNVTLPDELLEPLERLDRLELLDSPQLVQRVIESGQLLHGIRSVQQLNIMHNKLTALRSDLPSLLPRLQLLKLGGSRWDCTDPDIMWLKDWMAAGTVQFYSPFSARCRRPPRLLLKSVALLQESDFEAAPTPELAPATDGEPTEQAAVTGRGGLTTAAPPSPRSDDSTAGSPGTSGTAAATTTTGATSTSTTTTTTTTTTTKRTTTTTTTTTTTATTVTTIKSTIKTTTARSTTTTTTTSPAEATTVVAIRTTPKTTTAGATTSSPRTARPPASNGPPSTRTTASPDTPSSSSASPTAAPGRSSTAPPSQTATLVYTPHWRQPTAATAWPVLPPHTGRQPQRPPGPQPPVAQAGRVNFVPTGARGTMAALVGSMAAAVGVILALLAGAVCLWRYRRGAVYPFSRRRKDSSISYSQQKDEVNIVPEEGCGSEETTAEGHHGLSNVLYFMSQRGEAELPGESARPRPSSLLPHTAVDACPGAVADAWATPSPDAGRW